MSSAPTVLVIDDHFASDASAGELFYDRTAFIEDYGDSGYDFLFCNAWDKKARQHTAGAAIEFITRLLYRPALVLLDIRFGASELLGLDILRFLSEHLPTVPVVIMTSTPKAELWDDCAAIGAVDYLAKPIKAEILKQTLDRYCGQDMSHWLIGQSESFLSVVDQVARAAEGGVSSILLSGASGTGKELFARFIHRHGPHSKGPFMAVHIPSIAEQLVEGELFGYSKGAYTGALRDEPGRLLRANGGVLFLDEVGDLAPSVQAALLRVLETREVSRLGDGRTSKLKVQVVAATNANIAQMVKDNVFRLDLYTRLASTVVRLPQLSERLDDLEILLRHFVRRGMVDRSLAPNFPPFTDELVGRLKALSWPGNLRELWNYAQRVLDLARRDPPSSLHFLQSLPSSLTNGESTEDSPLSAGSERLLNVIPLSAVRASSAFLDELRLRELSLLWSALELTRDPLTGVPNRAKAASLIKGRKCSTNEFDRWARNVKSRLRNELQDRLNREYPELSS